MTILDAVQIERDWPQLSDWCSSLAASATIKLYAVPTALAAGVDGDDHESARVWRLRRRGRVPPSSTLATRAC